MLRNIATLEAICQHCATGRQLPPDMQAWLARSIERYLRHDCESLNEAFGVTQAHGGLPWWREAAIRARDAALRALAEAHFGDLTVYARARAIEETAARYETTCWLRDRLSEAMPQRYLGTPKEHLWRAFKSGAKMPISARRLRTLLRD